MIKQQCANLFVGGPILLTDDNAPVGVKSFRDLCVVGDRQTSKLDLLKNLFPHYTKSTLLIRFFP